MIMTRATYDRWLRDSELVALADDPPSATIRVRDGYAVDWCSHRLLPPIRRTLAGVLAQPDVALTFCAAPDAAAGGE
jgi:hypothetical protein